MASMPGTPWLRLTESVTFEYRRGASVLAPTCGTCSRAVHNTEQ
jgi:hypothetical protein